MVYYKRGFDLTNTKINAESVEHRTCLFQLNGKTIQHWVSKITPTKAGQFVPIGKRNQHGITKPFNIQDDIDFIVITTKNEGNFAQFIFPKSKLVDKGIICTNGKRSKRGTIAYKSWGMVERKQAVKTQNWQTNYFLKIKETLSTDLLGAKNLLTYNILN